MKKLLLIPFLLAILALFACDYSDDYLYDDSETYNFGISAFIATSFDSSSHRVKADSIGPRDTITFIGNVFPSKSIRLQKYQWRLDGKFFANEFSFRESIPTPGYHLVEFLVVDYFSDTLRDSIHLWVSNIPLLDTIQYIPSDRSQGLPYEGGVSFTWTGEDPDDFAHVNYQFQLATKGTSLDSIILDTLLTKSQFSYMKSLQPLTKYNWRVVAINEFGKVSKDTIKSSFSTIGNNHEGGVQGYLKSNATAGHIYPDSVEYLIIDSQGKAISQKQGNSPLVQSFTFGPLKYGSYKITAHIPGFPDFFGDTLEFEVEKDKITQLDSITIRDTIPPTIIPLSKELEILPWDTLTIQDTMLFLYKDGGTKGTLHSNIYLNGQALDATYKDSIITVLIPPSVKSFTSQLLSITTLDNCGNLFKKDFILRPNLLWFETNKDTTVSNQGKIKLYIQDKNIYGFVPEAFYLDILGDGKPIKILAYGKDYYEASVSVSFFPNNISQVKVGIIYTNGISQFSSWKLTKNLPPDLPSQNCDYPCQGTISTSAEFSWAAASDPEKDPLEYRVVYYHNDSAGTLIKDSTDYYRSTYITIDNLPANTYIYWWAEARDPFGGVSTPWSIRASVYVKEEENE